MKKEENSEEQTQPTRFFKLIEVIGDQQIPTAPEFRRPFNKNLTINNNQSYQPSFPKILNRRVATQISESNNKTIPEDHNSMPKRKNKQRKNQMRSIRSRSSFYSIETKGRPFQFKRRILKTTKDFEQYSSNLNKLQQLYELLSQLLLGIFEANPELIKECLSTYVHYMEQMRYQFLDHFASELNSKGQRVVIVSRIQEFMSVLFIAERVLLKSLKAREDALVNMAGFCASNVIFIAKLYILSRKANQKHPFQISIRQYQRANFRIQLNNYQDIITRMQHNNETIKITQIRNGRGDLELHAKLKNFTKLATMQRFTPSHAFSYLFQYFAYYLHLNNEVGVLQCLETSPAPYLAPQKTHLTVVIQPLGVLCCQKKFKMGIRPHCLQFLSYLNQRNCEIVLWTQAMPSSVKQVMKMIDPQKRIKHKLYRYHCTHNYGNYLKDIKRLGRDLDKTLIIDYSHESFLLSPQNGIQAPWNRSNRDKTLMDLIQIVSFLIKNESPVQASLSQHKKELDQLRIKSRAKSLIAHNSK